MTTPALASRALVVHLFVAVDGKDRETDHEYLLGVWRACGAVLGMTETVTGLPVEPAVGWNEWNEVTTQDSELIAARTRTGGVQEAVLRRERDTFCLTVMREPASEDHVSWVDLDRQWSSAMGKPSTGVIGVARLFQALVDCPIGPAPGVALVEAVRAEVEEHLLGTADAACWQRGIRVPEDFAVWEVWEVSAKSDDRAERQIDDRAERQIVVIAAKGRDDELSAWTWTRGDPEMTPFAKYLLHAAKLRYQRRVWRESQNFRQLRRDADEVVRILQEMVEAPARRGRLLRQSELLEVHAQLVSLQAYELGLMQYASRLREMRRTIDITAYNLAALTPAAHVGGLCERSGNSPGAVIK